MFDLGVRNVSNYRGSLKEQGQEEQEQETVSLV